MIWAPYMRACGPAARRTKRSPDATLWRADLACWHRELTRIASQTIFSDYQDRRSANTLRRQRNDLQLFCHYLSEARVGK
ncbi:hypothetical protein [Reticulibacter mediterranei]|uniref:hypothetical protein n=1 Tax=Reticulibacter mediterranei TaxID=2778369 RepID=UPI001C691B03|nr:hypothetical protein [Reticulibacter mediterranei]